MAQGLAVVAISSLICLLSQVSEGFQNGVDRNSRVCNRQSRVAVFAEEGVKSDEFSKYVKDDVAAVIVGEGRIGSFLKSLNENDALMTRDSGWPANAPSEGPIYICTRNDALDSVIETTPKARRDDLVFLQNGMLMPYLERKGLQENSQVLVYLAVAKLGDEPTDGITSLNPEGLTTATGKWAHAFRGRLAKGGLMCHVKQGDEFTQAMLEKLIWISAFMLIGANHQCTVGKVCAQYEVEFDELATELAQAGETALSISLDKNYLPRLKAYAQAVSHFPCAVKEFEWRNGWFYQLSLRAVQSGASDPLPIHTSLLYKLNLPLDLPSL